MMRYSILAMASLATYTACATATTTTAVGQGVFFHLPGRSNTVPALAARQKACFSNQVACDASCVPRAFQCCHVGQGQACQEGYHCYDQGCCPDGQTCSGPPKGCTAETKMCDVGCIPNDRVCCNLGDGSSCDPDTVCLAVGYCGRQKSALGSGSASAAPSRTTPKTGSSSFTAGASNSAATSLRTLSETAIGASVTSAVTEVSSGVYSLSPISTTTGSADSASPGASSSDKPKPTTVAGGSSSGSDKGAAGTTLKAPAILAGLLAVAAYII